MKLMQNTVPKCTHYTCTCTKFFPLDSSKATREHYCVTWTLYSSESSCLATCNLGPITLNFKILPNSVSQIPFESQSSPVFTDFKELFFGAL